MCTIVKRQNSSLQYLEQVRQHLARLPSIDPNTVSVDLRITAHCGCVMCTLFWLVAILTLPW